MYYDRKGEQIDLWTWAAYTEDSRYRFISKTLVLNIVVSTVWIGLDSVYFRNQPPLIFETMFYTVYDGTFFDFQDRYSTEDEAIKNHKQICLIVFLAQLRPDLDWGIEIPIPKLLTAPIYSISGSSPSV